MTERKWQFLPEGLDKRIKELEEEITDLKLKISEDKSKSDNNAYHNYRHPQTIRMGAEAKVPHYMINTEHANVVYREACLQIAYELGKEILNNFTPQKSVNYDKDVLIYRLDIEVVMPEKQRTYSYAGPMTYPIVTNKVVP